jgi:hypothetical protein
VFDFSDMQDPVMSFDLYCRLNNNSINDFPNGNTFRRFKAGVVMQASTNCGRSWETVGTDEGFNGQNWYDEDALGEGFTTGLTSASGQAFANGYWGDLYTGWRGTGLFDLKRYAGEEDVRFRFVLYSDYTAPFGTWERFMDEGFAFDNIVIREKPEKNVGVAEVLTASGCEGTGLDITVQLENQGTVTQRDFPVAFYINGALERTEVFNREILSGEQETFRFSLPYIPTANDFELTVSTLLAGDEDPVNDSKSVQVQISALNENYPVIADFDSWPNTTLNINTKNVNLSDGWINSQSDDREWLVRSGQVGSHNGGTGPENDHTQGNNSGKYIYIEATGGQTGDVAILMLPCLDLTDPGIPEPEFPALSFYYNMWDQSETQMGSLSLEVAVDGGAYRTVWEKSGNQGDLWLEAVISLAEYKGKTIQARFRGIRGSGFRSDIAIDDVTIGVKYDNDLEVVAVDGLEGGCMLTEDIPVRIANKGYAAQQGFRLGYMVHAVYDDGTEADFYTSVETDLYIGPNPETELDYRFTGGEAFDFTRPGTYSIRAFPELADDRLFVNDTTDVYTVVSYPKPETPMVDIEGPTSFCEGAATVDMVYETRWDREVDYTKGDWVSYRPADELVASVYVCTRTPLNNESPDSTDYWRATSEWSSDRDYQVGEWAFFNGGAGPYTAYVCTLAPTSRQSPADTDYWQNTGLTSGEPVYGLSYKWVYGELDSISGLNRLRNAELYMADGEGPHRYQLFVRNNFGCSSASGEIELEAFPLPEVDIETNGFVLTAQVTGVTANIEDYIWYDGAGDIVAEAQGRSAWIVREPGSYSVAVVDERGCRDTSEAVVANVTALDNGTVAGDGLSIWPNPASDGLQVSLGALGAEGGNVTVSVFDNTGRQVASWQFAAGSWQEGSAVPVGHLASGAYTLKATTSQGSATARFIKTSKQ